MDKYTCALRPNRSFLHTRRPPSPTSLWIMHFSPCQFYKENGLLTYFPCNSKFYSPPKKNPCLANARVPRPSTLCEPPVCNRQGRGGGGLWVIRIIFGSKHQSPGRGGFEGGDPWIPFGSFLDHFAHYSFNSMCMVLWTCGSFFGS